MDLYMNGQTDSVVKEYRKALERVASKEDSHMEEVPDDATLKVIDEVLYTYSEGVDEHVGEQLDKLEERIDRLEELLKSHFHRDNGDVAQQVKE